MASLSDDSGFQRGVPLGKETPVKPDGLDALDAGYVVEGLGLHGWRRVRRVRRVVVCNWRQGTNLHASHML